MNNTEAQLKQQENSMVYNVNLPSQNETTNLPFEVEMIWINILKFIFPDNLIHLE